MSLRFASDIDAQKIPVLKIDHQVAAYTLNDAIVPERLLAEVIILSGIRQRIFSPAFGEGTGVYCRSKDFETGHPTDQFPKELSNFPAETIERATATGSLPTTFPLDCGSCSFRTSMFGPAGRSTGGKAGCTEQLTLPMMIPNDAMEYGLVVAHFQRSALRPTRTYLRELSPEPTFLRFTKLHLQNVRGGSADRTFTYSVPAYVAGRSIPEENILAIEQLSALVKEVQRRAPVPVGTRNKAGTFFGVDPDAPDPTVSYRGGFF